MGRPAWCSRQCRVTVPARKMRHNRALGACNPVRLVMTWARVPISWCAGNQLRPRQHADGSVHTQVPCAASASRVLPSGVTRTDVMSPRLP